MKRTSLWETKERVRGTRRMVVDSWWVTAVERGDGFVDDDVDDGLGLVDGASPR